MNINAKYNNYQLIIKRRLQFGNMVENEFCWCCESAMTQKVVPFIGAEIWFCAVCTPDFDYVSFIENYDFWADD